jgi:predicted HTH transcriptional regulator
MAGFEEFIRRGSESSNLEYKAGRRWSELRVHIARTALGMANIEDGGVIVVGVNEVDGRFLQVGLNPDQVRSYRDDDVRAFINARADPHVRVDVHRETVDDRSFLVIAVQEFVLYACDPRSGHTQGGEATDRGVRGVGPAPGAAQVRGSRAGRRHAV